MQETLNKHVFAIDLLPFMVVIVQPQHVLCIQCTNKQVDKYRVVHLTMF